jgi:hypothetical protein
MRPRALETLKGHIEQALLVRHVGDYRGAGTEQAQGRDDDAYDHWPAWLLLDIGNLELGLVDGIWLRFLIGDDGGRSVLCWLRVWLLGLWCAALGAKHGAGA